MTEILFSLIWVKRVHKMRCVIIIKILLHTHGVIRLNEGKDENLIKKDIVPSAKWEKPTQFLETPRPFHSHILGHKTLVNHHTKKLFRLPWRTSDLQHQVLGWVNRSFIVLSLVYELNFYDYSAPNPNPSPPLPSYAGKSFTLVCRCFLVREGRGEGRRGI